MPSPKWSVAPTSNEPGTLPPTSAQWPLDCASAISSPSAKTGRMMRDVGEVRAAAVGVVDREHVAVVDVALEVLEHRLGLQVQRADVHGDVLASPA